MQTCKEWFTEGLKKYGYSAVDFEVKSWKRKRIDVVGRTERKRYPWSEYKRLYDTQGGVCPICNLDMVLIRGKVDMDHRNPNLTGEEFEARSNRAVCHSSCNRSKGAKSIAAQAKHYGRTMTDILSTGDEI